MAVTVPNPMGRCVGPGRRGRQGEKRRGGVGGSTNSFPEHIGGGRPPTHPTHHRLPSSYPKRKRNASPSNQHNTQAQGSSQTLQKTRVVLRVFPSVVCNKGLVGCGCGCGCGVSFFELFPSFFLLFFCFFRATCFFGAFYQHCVNFPTHARDAHVRIASFLSSARNLFAV